MTDDHAPRGVGRPAVSGRDGVDAIVALVGVVVLDGRHVADSVRVQHLVHGETVVDHGVRAQQLLGAGEPTLQQSQVIGHQLGSALGLGAVGQDRLTEAALLQVVHGQVAGLLDADRRVVVDLVALASDVYRVGALDHERRHAMIAVLILAEHLIGLEDVSRLGGEIPITEEGVDGGQALPQACHVVGVKDIDKQRHYSSLLL